MERGAWSVYVVVCIGGVVDGAIIIDIDAEDGVFLTGMVYHSLQFR